MLNSQTLAQLSQVEIDSIDPSALADISSVCIDSKLPHKEKVLSFIEKTGNPYCFRSGGVPVRIRFAEGDRCLANSLANYFIRLKQR